MILQAISFHKRIPEAVQVWIDTGLVSLQLGLDAARLQTMDERTLINEGTLPLYMAGRLAD
jgi:hypothetical protein